MRIRLTTLGYLAVAVCLLVSGSSAQGQKRKPPKDNRRDERPQWSVESIEQIAQELGPNWETEALKQLQLEEPEEAKMLEQERLKNPEKYRQKLVQAWGDLRRLQRLKTENPEKYQQFKKKMQLNRQSHELTRAYRQAEDATQKQQIRTQLKTCLAELFALREAERAEKVTELEQELERLREMLAFRQKNKDQIIEKRLDEMLQDSDLLEW